MASSRDRNFDTLIDRFEQRIYATPKGDWRLKLIKEDLAFLTRSTGLHIWDAGCGFAQIAQWLAAQGHRLTLCDISKKMLERAQDDFARAGLKAEFHQCSAQSLAAQLPEVDVLICHAVLEWLAEPVASLQLLLQRVRPGGYVSLLFYNRNAMVYGNILRGGWRLQHLLDDSYLGRGHRLTPPHPHYPHEMIAVLEQAGFRVKRHTGIRVFHDYLSQEVLAGTSQEELFALEHRYCRMPVYRDMGRYVHLLLQREEDCTD